MDISYFLLVLCSKAIHFYGHIRRLNFVFTSSLLPFMTGIGCTKSSIPLGTRCLVDLLILSYLARDPIGIFLPLKARTVFFLFFKNWRFFVVLKYEVCFHLK